MPDRIGPRQPALAVLLATAWAAPAIAQDAIPCAPRIEVAAETPARIAARLHALAQALPPADGDGCHAPRVRFAWTPQRLTVEVALDDGRIANRTLRSLDDALPTLLAVLSAPPEGTPTPPAPVPETARSPPPLPPPAEPVWAPPPVATTDPTEPLPAAVPARWRFVVAASAGLTTPVARDGSLRVFGAEAGFASGRLRLTLRVTFGSHEGLRPAFPRSDGSAGQGSDLPSVETADPALRTALTARTGTNVEEIFVGASIRHRAPVGRFRLEAGGSAGVASTRTHDANDQVLLRYGLRLGLESALALPLPWGTEVFLRGELHTDLLPNRDGDPLSGVQLAGMLSLGVGWGWPR